MQTTQEREAEIQNLIGKLQPDAPQGVEWWIGIDQEEMIEEDVPLGAMRRWSPRGQKHTIRICHYGICVFAGDLTTFALSSLMAELNKGLEQLSQVRDAVNDWVETERRSQLRPSASSMLGQLRSILCK